MVSKSPNQHKTVKTNIVLLVSLLFIFVFAGALISCYIIKGINDNTSPDPDTSIYEAEPEPEPEPEPVLPPAISFQTVIDDWANSVGGPKSVIIYDLDRDEIVGEFNPDESYNTASLYKLFVVYDGYRKVQSGEWQSDSPAGSTGYSIIECLDLAIRESNSSCAETLWGMIGRDDLATIITDDYHIAGSDISSLISNPRDILKMMQIFYKHEEITNEELIARMKDSFLVQPITTYNWRQGLPSGFSKANVYNKVGWDYNPDGGYWNIYHDAAIVEFPETNRHFIVVVMSNKVPFSKITNLGKQIEDYYYSSLND
ncbi:serine hydrolase [Candidatus Saccharibacteria bacterium]|nr:serine hydrolase [Candidatus Saccharibacteria bacterium]